MNIAKSIALVLAALVAGPHTASAQKTLRPDTTAADTTGPHTTFRLADLSALVQVGSAQISPDGKEIAIIVSRWDWKEDKSHRELDLVNVSDGSSRPLTYARDGVGSPEWSPVGGRLRRGPERDGDQGGGGQQDPVHARRSLAAALASGCELGQTPLLPGAMIPAGSSASLIRWFRRRSAWSLKS